MPKSYEENLLARLAGASPGSDGTDPYADVAASEPDHDANAESDETVDALLDRINRLAQSPEQQPENQKELQPPVGTEPVEPFIPVEPESFEEADLTGSEVEALILKYLLARGDAAGRDIAEQVKLPFVLIDELLRQMKNDRLVGHRGSAPMNDYRYELTDVGRERGRRYSAHCTYFGAAPVSLRDYIPSVEAQSLVNQQPTAEHLHRAFEDLLLNRKMLDRLGPAINSGRGLFLFGPPGNGKTSIAERITRSFGSDIWIPHAILVDGEIIQLYDPQSHEPIGTGGPAILKSPANDPRWIRIRRPTIIVGGELKMSALELRFDPNSRITEAPLQMKSNCGTLVIDDFGRQTMNPDELLNRWIVPLEKRYDFLSLNSGKKIQIPFDQLIVFSTNLEPKELVDDAFLRRIPYKINVIDPTENEFRQLLRMMAERLDLPYDEAAVDHLIEHHYRVKNRAFRSCQPRDLLLQIIDRSRYRGTEPVISAEGFDVACENYFTLL